MFGQLITSTIRELGLDPVEWVEKFDDEVRSNLLDIMNGDYKAVDGGMIRLLAEETKLPVGVLQLEAERDGVEFELDVETTLAQIDEQRGANFVDFDRYIREIDEVLEPATE